MSVSIAGIGGRGGLAPPLLDAVYGVHVYLHVLARLEPLAADGARVREVARRVHVQDVLLEVAIVAVELAALRARGLGERLTVSEGGRAVREALVLHRLRVAARPRRSWRSWGRRRSVQFALLANFRAYPYRLLRGKTIAILTDL